MRISARWMVGLAAGAALLAGGGALVWSAVERPPPAAAPPEELTLVIDELAPRAEACRGSEACFAELARPYGPLWATLGEKAGTADPDKANRLQNFGFGALGGIAGVDPMKMANEFHCGPPCAERRKAELVAALPAAREIVRAFEASGLNAVALWPGGAVRADDAIYEGANRRSLTRTNELGIVRTGAPGPATAARDTALAGIAAALRQTPTTAVAREPNGGIRLIHRDSLGDNEAGLLFITPERAAKIDDRQLFDGGRYLDIEPVADGVYFYIRT